VTCGLSDSRDAGFLSEASLWLHRRRPALIPQTAHVLEFFIAATLVNILDSDITETLVKMKPMKAHSWVHIASLDVKS